MTQTAQTFSTQAESAPQASAPTIAEPVVSAEEADRHYSALLDSVNLINALNTEKPDYMSEKDRIDVVKRNLEHLKHMRAKKFWGDRDMAPVDACIATAEAFLSAQQ